MDFFFFTAGLRTFVSKLSRCDPFAPSPTSVHQELLQLEDRLGSVSRGAVQTTIERFTFPHKYKKVGQRNCHLRESWKD